MRSLRRLGTANRIIVANASSLVGTTAVTSALGFVYWWLAAHQFPLEAVGFAAASISAMSLAGSLGALGLGTLLMGELPRQPSQERSLVTAALLAACLAGGGIGVLLAVVVPVIAVDLQPLAGSPWSVAL